MGESSSGGGNNGMWKELWQLEVPSKFKSPATITAIAQADIAMLKEINQQSSTRPEGRSKAVASNQSWQPPEWPFFKVNFDAAYDKNLNKMGMRIIMRDSEGGLLACLTAPKEQVFSSFQTERVALHRAMDMCIEMGMNQVIFEVDAKAVIDIVNSKSEDYSWHGQEIDDLQQLLSVTDMEAIFCIQVCKSCCSHSS
ncbi:uncharacterized protein LOC122306505 [Carya illinoinensis]|uniref:uncharacterized protein LOC122306505 n=1 Tax=Carya illinoinensis TaxID=32201 RepID=UPI001C722D22|nr:uncharacterized protein LOC122306505 [Carya illinoinensis]